MATEIYTDISNQVYLRIHPCGVCVCTYIYDNLINHAINDNISDRRKVERNQKQCNHNFWWNFRERMFHCQGTEHRERQRGEHEGSNGAEDIEFFFFSFSRNPVTTLTTVIRSAECAWVKTNLLH